MIVVDVNEPKKWQKIGDKVDDIGADFVVRGEHGKYVVERKTLSDLMHSIRNRRFWSQLDRLLEWKEQGYNPICMLHGSIYKRMNARYAKCSLPQWVGIKVAIMESKGIPVYYAINETEAVMYLKKLDEKVGDEVEEWQMPPVCKKVGRDMEQEAIDVLLAIYGIGFKTAKKLLIKFGSLQEIFNASEREIVKEIGEKKAVHLFDLMSFRFNGDEK